jgi:hypothetical protein
MSTYSTNLALELIGTGEQAGVWGTTTNTNLGTLIEQSISGYVTQAVATGTDTTITIPNGSSGVARNMYIELTGTGGASTNLIVPANKKLYFIFNNSTGAVTVKVSGQTGVSVPTGKKMVLVSNGTDIVNGINYIADFASNSATITHLSATSASITNLTLTSLVISNLSIASANITTLTGSTQTLSGNLTLNGGTANGVLYLNGSKVATSGSALTFDGTTLATTGKFGITGSGAVPTASALQIGTNAAGSRWLYNVPTGGEHNFTENGTVLSWQNISSLGWLIGGTEQMRLTSTGLGIGTSSPASKVEAVGASAGSTVFTATANTSANTTDLYVFRRSDAAVSGAIRYNQSDAARPMVIGTTTSHPFDFMTNGSSVARLDTSGNLGLGVTPSAWFSSFKAYQVGNQSLWSAAGGNGYLSNNAFFNTSSQYTYRVDGYATEYIQSVVNGSHSWHTAPSGTAGNTISFTQAMTLTAAGDLGVGTTSPGSRLDVVGSATTSGINVSVSNASTSGQFPSTNYLLKTYDGSAVTNVGALGGTSSTFSYQQVSANQLNLTAYRAGGLRISTANSGPIIFAPTTGADPDFATEVMRITPAGNLGIGTTSPTGKIATQVTASGTFQNAFVASDGTSSDLLVKIRTNETQIMNSGASVLSFGTNNTERARITAAGELLVGTATSGGYLFRVNDGVSQFTQATSATDCADFWNRATSGDNKFVAFYTETSATSRGSITYNRAGGLVAYNVTSDYRAKDIIGPVQNSGAIIDALKVYEGQMKGATQSRPMLVAHEAQEHAPYAVTGEKDAVNEDGTPKYQQMDVSALVPLLLAEIQSLRARVAQLETK